MVNKTLKPLWHANTPNVIAIWLFPTPAWPRRITFSLLFIEESVSKSRILSLLILSGKVKSNPSKVFIPSNLVALMLRSVFLSFLPLASI